MAHPWLVRSTYAISWLYLTGDVANEGYKAYRRQYPRSPPTDPKDDPAARIPTSSLDDYKTVMVQRVIFQSLASMGLPALTIHSVVKYSGKALKDAKNVKVRTWAPIGLGLAIVPLLPYLFDKPVEHSVDYVFKRGFEYMGMADDKVKEKEL